MAEIIRLRLMDCFLHIPQRDVCVCVYFVLFCFYFFFFTILLLREASNGVSPTGS